MLETLNAALLFSLVAHYEPEWHQLRVFLGLNAALDATFSLVEMATQFVRVF